MASPQNDAVGVRVIDDFFDAGSLETEEQAAHDVDFFVVVKGRAVRDETSDVLA
jgi:hypothetical protein